MLRLLLLAFAQDTPTQLVDALGHPDALVITGADAVGATEVRRALFADPNFFEASLPMQRLATYTGWLQGATTFAYQHAGFLDARVSARVDESRGEVHLGIVEGEPYLAAEPLLKGAIHLEEDWVRDVLRVGAVRRESASGDERRELFWVAREPAPASPVDRERFEALVHSAVESAGFLDSELRVHWDMSDDASVRPVITVAREGPRSVVHDVRFEGAPVESVAEVRAWSAVPDEAPASTTLRWDVEDRLQATGRFVGVHTRFEPVPDAPGRAVLAVQLIPNSIAPPLADQPEEDLELLIAGVSRLKRLGLDPEAEPVGLDLEVSIAPSVTTGLADVLEGVGLDFGGAELDPLRLRASVVQRSASLEFERLAAGEQPAPLVQMWIDAKRGLIRCPPLGLDLEFGPTDIEVIALVQGAVKTVVDDPARPVDLNVSGGLSTGGRGERAPVRIELQVHPSLLLYLLTNWTTDPQSDEEALRLSFEYEEVRAQLVTRRDASRLVVDVDMDFEGVDASFTLGDRGDREKVTRPDWVRATGTGTGVAVDDEGRWHRSALELLRTVVAVSSVGESHARVGLLGVTGVQALLSSPPDLGSPGRSTARRFHVPRKTATVVGIEEVRGLAERLATLALQDRVPGTWCDHLLICIPLLTLPANQNEVAAGGSLMRRIAEDPARGPFGAWLAAELCAALGRTNWSQPMAALGQEDMSAASFVADCETLLGSPSDELRGAGPRRIAATWKSLYRCALDPEDPLLTAAERASIKSIFDGASPDDDQGIWEAGLTTIWDELLKTAVARRLDALR